MVGGMSCSEKHALYWLFNCQVSSRFPLFSPFSFLMFLPVSVIQFICLHDLKQPLCLLSIHVLFLSNSRMTTLLSKRSRTDLCSGHHKTATILGCGQRDKTTP